MDFDRYSYTQTRQDFKTCRVLIAPFQQLMQKNTDERLRKMFKKKIKSAYTRIIGFFKKICQATC